MVLAMLTEAWPAMPKQRGLFRNECSVSDSHNVTGIIPNMIQVSLEMVYGQEKAVWRDS